MKAKLVEGLIAVAFVVAGFALISAVSIAYVVAIHPSTWQ